MSILGTIGTFLGSEFKNLRAGTVAPLWSTTTMPADAGTGSMAIISNGSSLGGPCFAYSYENKWFRASDNAELTWTTGMYIADPNSAPPVGSNYMDIPVILLQSLSMDGNVYPAGYVLNAVGIGGTNNSQIRLEDPANPRDRPFTTLNQSTGIWDWFNIADTYQIKWEWAKQVAYESPGISMKVEGYGDDTLDGYYGEVTSAYNYYQINLNNNETVYEAKYGGTSDDYHTYMKIANLDCGTTFDPIFLIKTNTTNVDYVLQETRIIQGDSIPNPLTLGNHGSELNTLNVTFQIDSTICGT